MSVKPDYNEATHRDDLSSNLVGLQNVTKQFSGTVALSDVSIDFLGGEVHCLFGENGAGKSTLIQLLMGVIQPTSGSILFEGRPMVVESVHQAHEMGIRAVFQEFSLVPDLTVAQNIFLGEELSKGVFLDDRKMIAEARRIFDRLGFDISLNRTVGSLSRAQQQSG